VKREYSCRTMRSLEELHSALVLLSLLACSECPQVSALAGLGIDLPGIKTVSPVFEFSDHSLHVCSYCAMSLLRNRWAPGK